MYANVCSLSTRYSSGQNDASKKQESKKLLPQAFLRRTHPPARTDTLCFLFVMMIEASTVSVCFYLFSQSLFIWKWKWPEWEYFIKQILQIWHLHFQSDDITFQVLLIKTRFIWPYKFYLFFCKVWSSMVLCLCNRA